MKKKVTATSLRAGQTIYKVYKVGAQSWIEKAVVLGKPHYDSANMPSLVIMVDKTSLLSFDCESYRGRMFLQDAGILPNCYNDHRAFYSLKKAIRYRDTHNTEPSLNLSFAKRMRKSKRVHSPSTMIVRAVDHSTFQLH